MLHTFFFSPKLSATGSMPMFRKLGYATCLLIGSVFLSQDAPTLILMDT